MVIKEDFVSFETAKLLKEKGFDIPCNTYFVEVEKETAKNKFKRKFCHSSVAANRNAYKSEMANHYYFSCPTLQMAMKWLREVHHLFIGVEPRLSFTDYYWITANIYRVRKKNSLYHTEPVDDYSCVACCDGDSFEDACESAIKYCLEKLI